MYKDRTNKVISLKIDSLRMEFPLSSVKLNSNFTDEYIVYNLTKETEVAEFDKQKMMKTYVKGVAYHTFINQRFKHKYFVVLLNSKMLHRKYFKGITIFTIKELYDNLMNQGHFYVDFKDFLSCFCYDIDFCIDIEIISDIVKNTFAISYYTDKAKPQYIRKINDVITGEVKRGNFYTGMQFGHRKEGSSTQPYCKIYNKWLELCSPKRSEKLFSFYERNDIKYDDLTNVWRFEFTIKSKKMLDVFLNTLNVEKTNKLDDLLDLCNNEDFFKRVKNQIRKVYKIGYIDVSSVKRKEGKKSFNSSEFYKKLFIDLAMREGYDNVTELINFHESAMKIHEMHRNTKSTQRKVFKKSIADYLNGKNLTPLVLKRIEKANVPLEEIYKLDEWFFNLKFHQK